MATDRSSKFFGNRVMPFLEKAGKVVKGVGWFFFSLGISLGSSPFVAFQLAKDSVSEESNKPQDPIFKKPKDPIIEELIKTQRELDKLKEQIKTLEQNQGTLCEDVEHLYELI